MECFKKAIKLNLISPDDINGNGSHIENLDKYKEAIEYLEKVISINPKDSEAHYNKGYALMNLKRYDEAIQY
jgi:tetratricopeptide (TPR) repeat protein